MKKEKLTVTEMFQNAAVNWCGLQVEYGNGERGYKEDQLLVDAIVKKQLSKALKEVEHILKTMNG